MTDVDPYGWLDEAIRVRRRRGWSIAFMAGVNLAVVSWHLWLIMSGSGTWWISVPAVLALLWILLRNLRVWVVWGKVHDQALLNRERYRMRLPPR